LLVAIFRRRANIIGTKNNLGLKKGRISPFPHRCAGQAPARGGHGGQKFPFPRPLSFFARPAFEFFWGEFPF